MVKTTLKIEGMMCGMCEAHVNNAIRNAFPVRKVTSSHKAGETVIESEETLDEAKLREIVAATGYTLTDINTETVEKKGRFSRRK